MNEISFEKLPRYLTPNQTSDLLQISKKSFYKHVHLGHIPVTKLGGSLRVDKFKLEKMLEDNSRGTINIRD